MRFDSDQPAKPSAPHTATAATALGGMRRGIAGAHSRRMVAPLAEACARFPEMRPCLCTCLGKRRGKEEGEGGGGGRIIHCWGVGKGWAGGGGLEGAVVTTLGARRERKISEEICSMPHGLGCTLFGPSLAVLCAMLSFLPSRAVGLDAPPTRPAPPHPLHT